MNLEYQKFKLLDEEKFRNRFASKKCNKAKQMNEETSIETLTTMNEHPNDNIRILLDRLDSLQKDVDKLKQHQTQSELGSDNTIGTTSKDARKIITEETKNSNIIDEAVKHLNDLENIIMALTAPEGHETSDMDSKPLNSSGCHKDGGSTLHSLSSSSISDSQERQKQIKQEEYANELKKQIEEKQRLKELERKKEREEDQVNFAETHEFNSLGHRVQVKCDEPVDQKPALLDTKHSRYARGGNGIFGDPLTESQKQANAMYRAELLSQIEEKKQREAKRIQEEREMDQKLKEQEAVNASLSIALKESDNEQPGAVSKTMAAPRSPQEASNKHNVCVQVALERKYPQSKPKATKVIRTSNQNEKTKDFSKLTDLLAQVTQLKAELAAEERRIQQNRSESENIVQVYDPRLINSDPSKIRWSASPCFARPMRVHRVIAAPVYATKVEKGKQDLGEPVSLSSSSAFLPHNEEVIQRSPSVDSLNLDEINRRIERRFERLRIHEDLYKNEEPIIRKFMAEEEARLMANSECY